MNAELARPNGLAGCADRMRNVVMQELDMAVGVKEASQSRVHVSWVSHELGMYCRYVNPILFGLLVNRGPKDANKASQWFKK